MIILLNNIPRQQQNQYFFAVELLYDHENLMRNITFYEISNEDIALKNSPWEFFYLTAGDSDK